VPDHLVLASGASILAGVTAVMAAVATRVRLLPEVIDISIIPTSAGTLSIAFVAVGALRGFRPERLARLSFGGTVTGGVLGTLGLTIGLVLDVL
jgi:hypothetical protein